MNKVKLFLNQGRPKLKGVKKLIAVWSAKGGVGKTTMAIAIAKELSKTKDTLLIDADITNPNVYDMLNLEKRLYAKEEKIIPVVHENLKIISMAGISTESIIWRGPLIAQAIEEIVEKTDLSEYLVIDMPPGTSDAAITIAQKIMPELILVATPQKEAITDLKKTIEFAKKMNLKIIGFIENMSGFFGRIDNKTIKDIGIRKLASIELDKDIANKDWNRINAKEIIKYI